MITSYINLIRGFFCRIRSRGNEFHPSLETGKRTRPLEEKGPWRTNKTKKTTPTNHSNSKSYCRGWSNSELNSFYISTETGKEILFLQQHKYENMEQNVLEGHRIPRGIFCRKTLLSNSKLSHFGFGFTSRFVWPWIPISSSSKDILTYFSLISQCFGRKSARHYFKQLNNLEEQTVLPINTTIVVALPGITFLKNFL